MADDGDPDGVDEVAEAGEVDDADLVRRWSEEDHVEAIHPRRNWTPVVGFAVIAVLVALVAAAVAVAVPDDDTDVPADGGDRGERDPSVLEEDPPSLDELTSEVTVPPGPETGLSVADSGVTIVEDRFDPARREGTFAAVVANPHPDWMAQGVQVDVRFIGEGGDPVGGDNGFIDVVLPGQEVAVASLFFDAPTVPVVDVAVDLDVARWRETGPVDGAFTTSEVTTQAAEYSGVRTTFVLRSHFTDQLTDVGVTAVYRDASGAIIGGADTFVDLLEPDVATPAEIALLANIPVDAVASTELYTTASFGYVPS